MKKPKLRRTPKCFAHWFTIPIPTQYWVVVKIPDNLAALVGLLSHKDMCGHIFGPNAEPMNIILFVRALKHNLFILLKLYLGFCNFFVRSHDKLLDRCASKPGPP